MNTNFRALFKTRREQAASESALQPGDAFPLAKLGPSVSVAGDRYMVLFISLSCRDCVELLTHLYILRHLNRRLVLVTDGTAEENHVFTEHFQFPFEVAGLPYSAFHDRFGIAVTPCAFLVEHHVVSRIGSPHTKAELIEFWSEKGEAASP